MLLWHTFPPPEYTPPVPVPLERILRKGDYVYGSFLRGEQIDGFINAVNPGDRSDVLGRFPFSLRNVDEAVDGAQRGWRQWRRVGLMDRATAVMRFRDHLHNHSEVLARLITRETGKPLWESRQEVSSAIRALDLYLDDGLGLIAPRVIEDIGARSDYLPRGVVGMVCPYTLPVLLGATLSAAAILGGNTVVLKPSKFTPATSQLLAELWDRCKLPRGCFNLLQGSGSVIGNRLLTHPGLDAVVFHGSYDTSREVRRALLERPDLPAFYQCGGKGISIVLDDADLDRAVYEVLVGACLSTGQRHNSTARVIVSDKIYDSFVENLCARTQRVRIGYGFETGNFMGPLVSESMRSRFYKYCTALQSRGHQPLLDGLPLEVQGYRGCYVRPGIYRVFWENGHPFFNDEPPGPVILLYRVKGWEEAVHLHNQALFRLVASIFTRVDNPALPELRDSLKTGSININRATVGSSLRLPASALGRSSNGFAVGLDLMRVLTYPRASIVEPRSFDPHNLVPGIHWGALNEEEGETTLELAVD